MGDTGILNKHISDDFKSNILKTMAPLGGPADVLTWLKRPPREGEWW